MLATDCYQRCLPFFTSLPLLTVPVSHSEREESWSLTAPARTDSSLGTTDLDGGNYSTSIGSSLNFLSASSMPLRANELVSAALPFSTLVMT